MAKGSRPTSKGSAPPAARAKTKPGGNKSAASPAPYSASSVVLRRRCQIGDDWADGGTHLADIRLAPGVSLNFLVDAIRNGIAGEE